MPAKLIYNLVAQTQKMNYRSIKNLGRGRLTSTSNAIFSILGPSPNRTPPLYLDREMFGGASRLVSLSSHFRTGPPFFSCA